ncbi:DUF4381 domain-containing protein [Aquabacter sp. CN5-332]|uniref:DUF4381 domain-containing protein n=1 Tax=Aquabacter sp. CN5-332 TaxID=3156608 RepID=UPI0032B5A754
MSDPADLSNLNDIVLPPAVSYWPPQPGWWILAAGLFAIAVIAVVRLILRYRANAYRRAALAELARIGQATDADSAQRISTILKRAALVAYPREQTAALTGPAWLAFLDRTGGTSAFTQGPARELVPLAFGAASHADGIAIARAAAHWVRRHRGGREC